MQDRYVADFGDYVKFAILRALANNAGTPLCTGVAWWLFPDEHHNADGGHRKYLDRPDEWKQFDPKLFESLLKINKREKRRVRDLEDSGLLLGARFANEMIPCDVKPYNRRPEERSRWLLNIKHELEDCDLIFLDPDNGIAPKGLKLTRRRAGKSVTIEDIKVLARNGQALLIYHHHTHFKGGHEDEIRNLNARLKTNGLRVSGALRATPWSPRSFFLLNGNAELCSRAARIAEEWNGHISWYPGHNL